MKAIRFNMEDGTVRVINPLWISNVYLKPVDGTENWRMTIKFREEKIRSSIFIKVYKDLEEANTALEYVMDCIEMN